MDYRSCYLGGDLIIIVGMNFSIYLDSEWVLALGCTEPAAIAYAVSLAAVQSEGSIEKIVLRVDPRMYKNCYAVGIPHSGRKIGIIWATALGAYLNAEDRPLALFEGTTDEVVAAAEKLIEAKKISVEVVSSRPELFIDVTVVGSDSTGRAVIEEFHTNVTSVLKDDSVVFAGGDEKSISSQTVREILSGYSLSELVALAREITDDDKRRLREGVALNLKIAEYGLDLFPEKFVEMGKRDRLTEISQMVCAGVYARMCGEDFPVMSLAGSGNKGIVASVPIHMWCADQTFSEDLIYEALAVTCLITSVATHHLGSLSAVCGCSNAAGIGLACGLVYVAGGSEDALSRAINNMVGNITGMICDGAKIGCALKTMTAVDSAFRSSSLALNGIGIPVSDGIVAGDGIGSLKNMAKIANDGMVYTDKEILKIMGDKSR